MDLKVKINGQWEDVGGGGECDRPTWYMATNDDFTGSINASTRRYIGDANFVMLPANYGSTTYTRYQNVFENSSLSGAVGVTSTNTRAVDFTRMFMDSTLIKTLDLSCLYLSIKAYGLVMGCTSLEEIYFCASEMFFEGQTGIRDMFNGCSALKTVDLSSFNTTNVLFLENLFNGCASLDNPIVPFDTAKVTNIKTMFNGCVALTTLDLSTWDMSKVSSNSNKVFAFNNCTSLSYLYTRSTNDADILTTNSYMPAGVKVYVGPPDGTNYLYKITT